MHAVSVPFAILGCGTFGGIGAVRQLIGKGLDASEAFETMDEAASLGIDLWDTAERYADGASETMIGAWLRSRPSESTARIRIATKVAPASATGDRTTRFDRKYIEAKLEGSLARLGPDRVELFLAHASCDVTPIQDVVEAFAAVAESGRAYRLLSRSGCPLQA